MTVPDSPPDDERTDDAVVDGDGRPLPPGLPGKAEMPSGHALPGQNKGTLLAFGIVCGVVLLFIIVGAIIRAVN